MHQQCAGLWSTADGPFFHCPRRCKNRTSQRKSDRFHRVCKRHDLQIPRRSGSKLLDFLVLHKNVLSFVKFVALDDFISPYKAVAVRAKKRLVYPCVAFFVDLVEICTLTAAAAHRRTGIEIRLRTMPPFQTDAAMGKPKRDCRRADHGRYIR